MSPTARGFSLGVLLLAAVPFLRPGFATAAAQAPTLPSDTLEANFAPPSEMAPMPELAPSLPSDTIMIGAPLDDDYEPATDSLNPGPAPDDSIADPASRSQY
jgi:hypothetical protein